MIGGIIGIIVILVSGIMLFSMSRIEKYPVILAESLKDLSYEQLMDLHKDIFAAIRSVQIRNIGKNPYKRLYLNYLTVRSELIQRERTAGTTYRNPGNYQSSFNGLGTSMKQLLKESVPVQRKKRREKILARRPINSNVGKYRK